MLFFSQACVFGLVCGSWPSLWDWPSLWELSQFVGVVPVCGTGPVCESYIIRIGLLSHVSGSLTVTSVTLLLHC